MSRRWVGLDAQLMLLSGGMASHCSIIVRKDGKVWVYSAENDPFFSKKERGIQKTELSEWMY